MCIRNLLKKLSINHIYKEYDIRYKSQCLLDLKKKKKWTTFSL